MWKWLRGVWKEVLKVFRRLLNEGLVVPIWFSQGRTVLLFKSGDSMEAQNYRPITCLNKIYKWYTGVLLEICQNHMDKYGLLQREQRGARLGSWGCPENLLVDRMVMMDSKEKKRNLSMAWIDYKKAY